VLIFISAGWHFVSTELIIVSTELIFCQTRTSEPCWPFCPARLAIHPKSQIPFPYPINFINLNCVTLLLLVTFITWHYTDSKKRKIFFPQRMRDWFHKYSKKGNLYADHIIPASITGLKLNLLSYTPLILRIYWLDFNKIYIIRFVLMRGIQW
jgi:hypothetical protein